MTQSVDVSAMLMGIGFANPLSNASGVSCRYHQELDALNQSAAGSFITKSCTRAPRPGNPEPRYQATALGSINSMGLPNEGFNYYLDYASGLQKRDKPIFLSVSGLNQDENLTILSAIHQRHLPVLVELNLSCPNVPGKPQIGYDFTAIDQLLTAICREFPHPFGVKLPPYFDLSHFDEVAALLNHYSQVQFITAINSIGNGLIIDIQTRRSVIHPKGGFGGIGGEYVLPTALANVHAFYQRCPDKQIIGCGGIRHAEHIIMHVLAGATLVQIGTALYEEGPGIFTRLLGELTTQLQQMQVERLADLRGALQTCPASS